MPTRRDRKAGPLRGTRPTQSSDSVGLFPRHSVGRVPRQRRERGPAVLSREFYERPTLTVARELLGKVLVHRTAGGTAAGIIVETEAYIGEDDPACHAAPGPTRRNAPLYGPPGLAYVYLNYGIHYLVNAVTEAEGHPAAVLIRALEPLDGLRLMAKRRAPDGRHIDAADLCRGPGNLTRALGITLTDNLLDLTLRPGSGQASSRLYVEDRGITIQEIASGPRIGITVGVDKPWRFWVAGNPSVSGRKR
jgi:DNA-3-methyladenine glycosylase